MWFVTGDRYCALDEIKKVEEPQETLRRNHRYPINHRESIKCISGACFQHLYPYGRTSKSIAMTMNSKKWRASLHQIDDVYELRLARDRFGPQP